MLLDNRAHPRRGRGGVLRAPARRRVLGSFGILGLTAAGFGVVCLGPPAGAVPVESPSQMPTITVTERVPAPAVTVTRRPPTVTETEALPTVTETAPAPTLTVTVTATATATVSESAVATAQPNPTATVRVTTTETAPAVAPEPSGSPGATASPDEPERTVPAGATTPAPSGRNPGASVLAGAVLALVAVGGVYAACRAVVYLR